MNDTILSMGNDFVVTKKEDIPREEQIHKNIEQINEEKIRLSNKIHELRSEEMKLLKELEKLKDV